MTNADLKQLLSDKGACADAQNWIGNRNLETAWNECERGDWLLWLAERMIGIPGWPTRQQITLAACACAETVLKFVPEGEDRPRIAIETTRRWARGEATIKEVRAARQGAWEARSAAYAAAYAAYAAAYAAYAAAYAAYAAADAAYAAYAAADAAYAAYAAADAAYAADARSESLKQSAAIVRAFFTISRNHRINPKREI